MTVIGFLQPIIYSSCHPLVFSFKTGYSCYQLRSFSDVHIICDVSDKKYLNYQKTSSACSNYCITKLLENCPGIQENI